MEHEYHQLQCVSLIDIEKEIPDKNVPQYLLTFNSRHFVFQPWAKMLGVNQMFPFVANQKKEE